MLHIALLTACLLTQAPVIQEPVHVIRPTDAGNDDGFGQPVRVADDRLYVRAPIGNRVGRSRVYVYSTENLEHQTTLFLDNEDGDKLAVSGFAAENGYVLLAHAEWTVHLIEIASGRVLYDFPIPTDRDAWGFGKQIILDVEANRLLFAASNFGSGGRVHHSHVALFNFETRQQIAELEVPGMSPHIAGFGELAEMQGDLVVVSAKPLRESAEAARGVYLFDAETGAFKQRLLTPDDRHDPVFGSTLALSDRYLVVGGEQHLHVYDRQTFACLRSIPFPDPAYQRSFNFDLAIDGDDLFAGYAAENREAPQSMGGIGYHFDLASGELRHQFRPQNLQSKDRFGISVDCDDRHVYFSASGDDQAGRQHGAVYVFARPSRD